MKPGISRNHYARNNYEYWLINVIFVNERKSLPPQLHSYTSKSYLLKLAVDVIAYTHVTYTHILIYLNEDNFMFELSCHINIEYTCR